MLSGIFHHAHTSFVIHHISIVLIAQLVADCTKKEVNKKKDIECITQCAIKDSKRDRNQYKDAV